MWSHVIPLWTGGLSRPPYHTTCSFVFQTCSSIHLGSPTLAGLHPEVPVYSRYKVGIYPLPKRHKDVIFPSLPLISHSHNSQSPEFISFFSPPLCSALYYWFVWFYFCPAPTSPIPAWFLRERASQSFRVRPEPDTFCTFCPHHFPECLWHTRWGWNST